MKSWVRTGTGRPWPVLLPAVGEVPDQLLLLDVHAENGVPGVQAPGPDCTPTPVGPLLVHALDYTDLFGEVSARIYPNVCIRGPTQGSCCVNRQPADRVFILNRCAGHAENARRNCSASLPESEGEGRGSWVQLCARPRVLDATLGQRG